MSGLQEREVVGSVLHGAYGDVYEQALCLKHLARSRPDIELRLFAASEVRLEAFKALDLSFASCFLLWNQIEAQPEIDRFFQFQIEDSELKQDVLNKLSSASSVKFDRTRNVLPWNYMREHSLLPATSQTKLELSESGRRDLPVFEKACGITAETWMQPTISFLWRYRKGAGAISSKGQKTESQLVAEYSGMFRRVLERFDARILVLGMNVATNDSNRAITDNKYPSFGLDLPPERTTYLPGKSWPLELEISSKATVCCGHPSGFTEAQWIKRGRDVVLMDPPPHYLAKLLYRRMPLFNLNKWNTLVGLGKKATVAEYEAQISKILENA